jgi:hypothetical protein
MKRALLTISYFLLFGFLLSGCFHKKKEAEAPARPKIQEPVNTVPLQERVYSQLSISKGGKFPLGTEITLTISDHKGASEIEYELEYQAGTLVQVGLGSIVPKNETAPFTRNILLGTCSAGGACDFHEDVKGGALLLRFKDSSVGSLKGEWNYFQPQNDGKYSSRDGKFQLDGMFTRSFVIVGHTIGLPEPVKTKVLAGPYHLDTTSTETRELELTIRLSEASDTAKLLRWDGRNYKQIPAEVSDKTLTASISSTGTYLVVQ